MLVHVESFDNKSRQLTKLSISTKIPEYLATGKPIIAIGPREVASLEYLKDCSLWITNKNDIYNKIKLFSRGNDFLAELSMKTQLKNIELKK